LRFGYTLYWTRETDMTLSSNEVVCTRVGANPRAQDQRQFSIDFQVPKLTAEDTAPSIVASCGTNGTITEQEIYSNKADKTWRVFLNMLPKPGQHESVDLKCALKNGNEPVSETWSYRWSPP
jgi:glucans biosynthesis protein